MGVNSSKPTNFEGLMDNSSNNGLNTSKKNNPANQSIEAVDISEDSDEEDPNSEISTKSLSTTRKFFYDSQPILVPEDADQSFFTDNHMYPDAVSSQASPARLKSSKKASECIRATCESRDSLDNDLELSAIESASIDDLADSSLFDILDEEFELRDPMEQQLLKRKVSPGRNSCEPLLKKQKIVDNEEEEVADVDAEMGRMIQLEKKKMKALKERLKEENRLKWMESYKEAIYEEVGDEEDQYLPWVEREPPEPPRYLNILMQALEAQADARCGKRTGGPEEMAFEKQRKELGQDDLSSEGSDERNDEDDDNVRQKRKKGAKGQALERNGSGMWGSNARSFASNDEELQKLNDTWETGTFSSVDSTDSENGARADFIKRLRANSMSFLDAPYFLPSDVQCEMEVDEEAEAESRSTLRSDLDIFTDGEEEGENGKDADDGESLISEDISVGEDKEDEKGVGEDEESKKGGTPVDKSKKGGAPVDKPKKGGAPVDKPEKRAAPVDKPEKRAAPIYKPEKGGSPVDKPKKGGAPVDKRQKGAAPVDKRQKGAAPIYKPEKGGAPVNEPEKGGLPVDEDEEFEKAANEPKKGGTPVVAPKKSGGPLNGPEKSGGPVNGPEKGGAPVAEEEEVEKAANGPEKAGKPVNEHKKCGAPAAEVVPSRVETELPLNKQKSAESVIILESQEVIDVPSSSDDESQPDDAPVLPEDEVNVADFLETSMVEEEEELNVLPPEVLVNPFFSKKRKQKRNTEVTTANTSISTFQLPDAFDMKYLEITITPMASNDPENPQMSDSIKIRAENSNRPKITKKKETKGLRTPMKVKISRDQKLMHKNKINNGGKCATKGTKNVPPKEIVEIDLVDSDD